MRLWSLHPRYLDCKGLVALWREALLAQKVLLGETKGYKYHPQLVRFREQADPLAAIGTYLFYVYQEGKERGYNFNQNKILSAGVEISSIPVKMGQLVFEKAHLLEKLKVRAPEKASQLEKIGEIDAHPLFSIVPGGKERWEKIKLGGSFMAKENSFDIVSEVNLQEVDNAVNQTVKEISQRFDFKGSKADVELIKEDEIKVVADDEYKLKSVIDILQSKMVRRGVSLKFLEYGKIEPAAGGTVRQIITIKKGISKEKGKEIVNAVKNLKLKVQAQIQDDQVRVSGKERDDLQKVIQHLKQQDFGIELQFTNYRTF